MMIDKNSAEIWAAHLFKSNSNYFSAKKDGSCYYYKYKEKLVILQSIGII